MENISLWGVVMYRGVLRSNYLLVGALRVQRGERDAQVSHQGYALAVLAYPHIQSPCVANSHSPLWASFLMRRLGCLLLSVVFFGVLPCDVVKGYI